MKILKNLILLGMLGASLSCFGANRSGGISDVKMKVEMKPAPLYKIINGLNVSSSYKHWMVINLSYKMPSRPTKVKNKPYTFIDNPYIEWEIVTHLLINKKKVLGRVTGRTNYWSIPVDGKKHKALAVVPPIIMDRYFLYKGSNVLSTLNKSIFIKATLYTSDGKSLATWISDANGCKRGTPGRANIKGLFSKMANKQDVVTIKGGIYPKNKSAWSFINIQEYDLIKEEEVK